MAISFKPRLIPEVFNGNKTVTRRSASSGYAVGQEHAILPGMARQSMGRLRVTAVETLPLEPMDDDEARAEGFADLEEFKAYWLLLHKSWDPGKLVKRIEFVVLIQTHRLCGCCDGDGISELEQPRITDGEVH